MSNLNYICDSTSSSISDMAMAAAATVAAATSTTTTTKHLSGGASSSNTNTSQIITYELERKSINTGFGFDLKGDRPCIISAVHPGTIAYQSGLTEGDLVIAINNRKCTDLDHQHVVSLISRCKHKLVLKVTKARKMSKMAAVSRAHKAAAQVNNNNNNNADLQQQAMVRARLNKQNRENSKKSKRIPTSKGLNWVKIKHF